jgi:hypothetical protein
MRTFTIFAFFKHCFKLCGYLGDKAERLRRELYTGVGGVPEEKITLGGYRIMFKDIINTDIKETQSEDLNLIAMRE